MSVDELNRRVTNAIVRAESLPADSRAAWDAVRAAAIEPTVKPVTFTLRPA